MRLECLTWIISGSLVATCSGCSALGRSKNLSTADVESPCAAVGGEEAVPLKVPVWYNSNKKSLGEYRRIIADAERVLVHEPNHRNSFSAIGLAHYYVWLHYCHTTTELDNAITALRRNIEADPGDWFPNLVLSELYCVLGRHRNELVEKDEFVRKNPSDWRGYQYRAGVLAELGEIEGAIKDQNRRDELINSGNAR